MVQVQHQGVGALDQGVGRVLVLLQEGELVDNERLQLLAVLLRSVLAILLLTIRSLRSYLETSNLLLDIVGQITEARTVRSVQRAQLPLKGLLVQHLADAHTAARGLVTVAGTDTLTGGADLAAAETGLLQTVNDGVQIEADVRAVGDENALAGGGQALGLELGQLLEEAGNVDHGAGTDQVDT